MLYSLELYYYSTFPYFQRVLCYNNFVKVLVIHNGSAAENDELGGLPYLIRDFDRGLIVWEAREISNNTFENAGFFDCIIFLSDVCELASHIYKNTVEEKDFKPIIFLVDQQYTFENIPLRPAEYLFKNASNSELHFRIEQALVNQNMNFALKEEVKADLGKIINDLSYSRSRMGFEISGENINLTYKEFQLLDLLVKNREKTYSRDMISQELWSDDEIDNLRVIDVHIRRIRAKLGPTYSRYLCSLRAAGYYWTHSPS